MSNSRLTTIHAKLETIAAGKWNGNSSGLRDILTDAIRHQVIKKDDLATALGCAPPHLNSTIINSKLTKITSGLKSLGFGT